MASDLMTFEEYLAKKKIAGVDFLSSDPQTYEAFKTLFDQMHPESFTAQKLFLINKIRRRYPINKRD